MSLTDAKAHLRCEENAEDVWIERAIRTARRHCEEIQGRTYATRRWRLSLERWPSGPAIRLPRPPLRSVEAITYTLADGTTETVSPELYMVDTDFEPGAVHLLPGAAWPSGEMAPGMPIRVDFMAGYGGPSDVPDTVIHAMLMLIGHWFENREAVLVGVASQPVEFAVNRLLWPEQFRYSGPE